MPALDPESERKRDTERDERTPKRDNKSALFLIVDGARTEMTVQPNGSGG